MNHTDDGDLAVVTDQQLEGSLTPLQRSAVQLRPKTSAGALLPGPSAGDLHLQGEAQEGSHQHDDGKVEDILQRRRHRYRSAYVARNEKLQADQNGAAQLLAESVVCGSAADHAVNCECRRDQGTDDDHGYTSAFEAPRHELDGRHEGHGVLSRRYSLIERCPLSGEPRAKRCARLLSRSFQCL